MKISLTMASFERAHLLDIGLSSIVKYKTEIPLEIIVVNDGTDDDTEGVCKLYMDRLDIKYIFAGKRNFNGIVKRNPCFANNIAVKASTGDILVLSCPEIYHITDSLNHIVSPLLKNKKLLTTPHFMYFDNTCEFTNYISMGYNSALLPLLTTCKESIQMPFLMGMWKEEFMKIGGYDEDFTGYAGDDNDLMDRLLWNGCRYHRVPIEIIHLFHEGRCDSQEHFENPAWKHNYDVRKAGKGKIVRNVGREWGII